MDTISEFQSFAAGYVWGILTVFTCIIISWVIVRFSGK
jgi:hypothetical protein